MLQISELEGCGLSEYLFVPNDDPDFWLIIVNLPDLKWIVSYHSFIPGVVKTNYIYSEETFATSNLHTLTEPVFAFPLSELNIEEGYCITKVRNPVLKNGQFVFTVFLVNPNTLVEQLKVVSLDPNHTNKAVIGASLIAQKLNRLSSKFY